MKYNNSIGLAVFATQDVKRIEDIKLKQMVEIKYYNRRDTTITFNTDEHTTYIIIPATLEPNQEIKYSILIYSHTQYTITSL